MKNTTKTMVLLTLLASGCTGGVLAPPSASDDEARANIRVQWAGYFDKEARVRDVAWPLMTANVDFCEDRVLAGGWFAIDHVMFAATRDDRVYRWPPPAGAGKEWERVQNVAKDSPAAQAGMRPGDVYRYVMKRNDEWMLERRSAAGTDTLRIEPVQSCAVWPQVTKDPSVNAATDGQFLGVTEGLIDYVESDDELAFVVAHELAHIALDHIGKIKGNSILRGLGGALLCGAWCANRMAESGMTAYSVEFETESDYMGAYMTARAGFDPTQGAVFFARMMSDQSTPAVWSATHPVNGLRELNAVLYADEIAAKLAAGEALEPEKHR